MSYSKSLNDPRWQKRRLQIFERDNWKCKKCGEDKITLHVHHINYKGNPWEALDEDLETLCENCHSMDHCKGEKVSIAEIAKQIKAINSRIVYDKSGKGYLHLILKDESYLSIGIGEDVELKSVGKKSQMEELINNYIVYTGVTKNGRWYSFGI